MSSSRRQLLLNVGPALAFGLALRLWFITHAARIAGDTLIYGDIARNWLQHGLYGFGLNGGAPHATLIRLPGYPLFLAVCFSLFGVERYTAVILLQALIDLLTCLLLAALAVRLFGRRSALAALWLAALCPFTANYVSAPLTETLTLFCIASAFYALHRWTRSGADLNRWLLPLTASLAYALLLRPEQGLLAASILPAMVWIVYNRRLLSAASGRGTARLQLRTFTPILLVALGTLLPLAPWTLRNWQTFHVVQPLAPRYATDPGEDVPLGFQRWYRTWAIDFASTENVYWNYDGSPIEISDLPTRAFDSNAQYTRTAAILTLYNQTYNASPELDTQFNALASERIHADPIRFYIALPVARLLNMILRPRTEMLATPLEWWHARAYPSQATFAASWAALNLLYMAAGLYGLARWHKLHWRTATTLASEKPLAFAMLATILLRCALLLTMDNSEPRYTLEFFPILVLFASAAFAQPRQQGIGAGPGTEAVKPG